VFKLLLLPFKIVIGFLKLSGVKGGILLAIGVAIGLLIAPQRGSVLRARLAQKLRESNATSGLPADEDLSL
jgi:hypothetical protein